MKVRFHAGARDLAGTSETEHAPVADVAALRDALAARFPELAAFLPRMRFAVDDEFATDTTALSERSVVDVLPPVAGGRS